MADEIRIKTKPVVLVGPHAGKTIKLGGFQFVDGVTQVPAKNGDDAENLLGNFWNAHPEGSEALRKAQEAWDANPSSPAYKAKSEAEEKAKAEAAAKAGKK